MSTLATITVISNIVTMAFLLVALVLVLIAHHRTTGPKPKARKVDPFGSAMARAFHVGRERRS